ncbi:MAG: MmgE/PrpD family protein [Burkholderiales bacterium]|nr:MmgE/PrpD family protein [Burkholderiales bacterium]
MTACARELTDFLHGLRLAAAPASVAEAARWALLDTLGCALFGAPEPWSRIMAAEMLAEAATGRSTIVGHRRTVPAPAAALCNGTAAHGFELDDHLDEAIVHPGAIVVSTAFAAAEAIDASGARLLLGIIAGYEVLNRVGLALGVAPAQRGYHKTAVAGPLGAAAAAAVVLRLPADQLFTAVCLACACASGTKAFATGGGGGMEKRMHAGRAAEAGLRMAQLAARGFTAPPTALDGRFGLLDVIAGDGAQPERLRAGLGEHWAVEHVYVKIYPCCAWIQAAVQQLVTMRGPRPLALDEIAKVRVGVSAYAKAQNGAVAPLDTFGAQFSIPYCCALALMGDPADPAMYSAEAVDDPDRRVAARRIEIVVDPEMEAAYPRHYGARVELELANGECKSGAVLDPHGMPADPCTHTELLEKFKRLAGRTQPPAAVASLIATVADSARLPSVRALGALLRE